MNTFWTRPVSMLALAALILASPVAKSQTAPADAAPAPAADSTTKKDDVVLMDKFIASGDTNMAATPSGSVFGFDKSVEETPRVVTIVSDAQLQSLNILKSEDVVKADPATYSNFRFGLQGTVTIRNQSSDFFFNGMRRIDPQGIFESVWGAYDSLQIVEGVESTVYGLGRLGGYINFIPKSARAANNSYITTDAANISVQYGSWNTTILKVDYQTPATFFGKPGGLSLFVEMKNSDGYKANGFSRQQLIQGGYTVDLTPDWRAEIGFSFQISTGGLPGGDNRTLASTVEQKVYWSGNFSYQMDENGDGKIDEKEKRDAYFWGTPQTSVQIPSAPTTVAPANYSSIAAAGAATVTLVGSGSSATPSATAPGLFRPSLIMDVGVNDSLYRTIPWQGGAVAQNAGNWTRDGGLTVQTGPISMSDYLKGYTDTAGPALVGKAPVQRLGFQMMFYPNTSDNFGNYIPGVTKSGSVPYKGVQYAYWLPPTMDLNPTSFVAKPWNKKMSLGEDYYQAHIPAFYFNLINDQNADYTIKDQIFIDSNDQTKAGSNAYSQTQHPTTFEDKFTVTRKYNPFSWMSVQTLASANYWHAWTALTQNTGDSDIDMRRDLQRAGPTGQVNSIEDTFTSNDRWYGMTESSSFVNGLPVSYILHNDYSVTGLGAEFDTTLFKKFDLTTGIRWDYIAATAVIPAGVMDLGGTGSESVAYLGPQNTSAGVPSTYISGTGSYIPFSQTAYGNSNGGSETVSLSYAAPYDTHPYITYANTAALQNGTGSGTWSPQTVKNSILGRTTLFEVGVKGSLFKQVSYSFAYYNQFRANFQPLTTTGGGTSNNISRGEEAKLTYQATKKLTFSLGGNWSLVHNEQGGSITEPASAFGAPDVVDPSTGRLLIPADALTWGGRIQTTIPDSEPRYRRAAGIPAAILTATANYDIGGGFYVGSTFYYQSKFSLDRLDTMWVPDGHTFDGVFGYRTKKWDVFINATNMFNANVYNFAGFATWVDPKFQRALAVTLERHF